MSPEFCLRWNNHRPNMVNVFKELLQAEILVDVTLSAGGEFIHAHRLILSACSLYFKELFACNPCQHPIVILKDFQIEDLKTVIDFIYQGEVNVAQERLPHVLKTAETLRIKGLAENPRSFEEFQTSSSQQFSRIIATQQSSESVEGEEGAGGEVGSSHQGTPPPHKRRRVTGFDTSTSQQSSSEDGDGIRVKEEPSNSNTKNDDHSRRTDDEGDTANPESHMHEPAMILPRSSLSPGGGGGDENNTPGSPPPPQHSSNSPPCGPPSLNNNGDSTTDGAAAVALLQQGQGTADWPLPLSPWWVSVLPALARQQQNTLQHSRHSSFLQPPPNPTSTLAAPTMTTTTLLNKIKSEQRSRSIWPGGTSSAGQWTSPSGITGSGRGATSTPPALTLAGLDQLSLVTALGKEVSPQMVQALQAVATRQESFSSAAKLYSVSVTTLWRYFKKLNLSDLKKDSKSSSSSSSPCTPTTYMP